MPDEDATTDIREAINFRILDKKPTSGPNRTEQSP
jgi:hypothetical protein